MPRISWLIAAAGLFLCGSVNVRAQQSRCADCHFANLQAAPEPEHLADWEHSPHGRNDVGCDRCHGGDPTTFESFRAHAGILNSRNPASPAHRSNLPKTCGACHVGPFVAFQKSRHYELLQSGERRGPTCTTCHDSVAARLLSPRSLESQCDSCHGDGGVSPNPEYPPQGKMLLEQVREVRELLSSTRHLIRHVNDDARRSSLEERYEQAQVPLTEATQSAHEFVFDDLRERLSVARERTDSLMKELANP